LARKLQIYKITENNVQNPNSDQGTNKQCQNPETKVWIFEIYYLSFIRILIFGISCKHLINLKIKTKLYGL
jgi:hypothetical protein